VTALIFHLSTKFVVARRQLQNVYSDANVVVIYIKQISISNSRFVDVTQSAKIAYKEIIPVRIFSDVFLECSILKWDSLKLELLTKKSNINLC
jgi:hypothetical protein